MADKNPSIDDIRAQERKVAKLEEAILDKKNILLRGCNFDMALLIHQDIAELEMEKFNEENQLIILKAQIL